ncbi:MAG: c-type cytochrome domain-containing protein, partial [Pirellulaceae bacterium]
MQRLLPALLIVTALSDTGFSDEIMYETDVRPILKTHCFQCHGERGTVEASLDLRLRRSIIKGGESGPAIVPGNPAKSLLIQRVSIGEMPPDDDKHLSAKEVETLSRWVEANAPTVNQEPESLNDGSYFTDVEKQWWAFQPVQRPEPPSTRSETSTPIDAFILHEL